MAPTTIRKALGAVKDQTSISIAKVSSAIAPELDVLVVKATSHDDEPAEDRHVREILNLTYRSRPHIAACVAAASRRLGKTRDWIVAVKALMLIHRLLADGDPAFLEEVLHATRRGTRLLNMADFRDEAHSSSWDHSAFVRTYALYLDQWLECALSERKDRRGRDDDRDYDRRQQRSEYGEYDGDRRYYDDDRRYDDAPRGDKKKPKSPAREMATEKVLERMQLLQLLLERFLACRPTGKAKSSRMILVALYPVVRESFQLYADISEILTVLLDRFSEMGYSDSVKAFDAYTSAAKQIDELVGFYGWCRDTGVARSSEYPEVDRITDKLLQSLEDFMIEKRKKAGAKSPENGVRVEVAVPVQKAEEEDEPIQEDMNSIKALPAPEGYEEEKSAAEHANSVPQQQQQTGDLVDLREQAASADEQGNKLALALFSAANINSNNNGAWEPFPSSPSASSVTSAWQTPAAESGKADWELALVETASNLSKQKAALGGGLDPVLLDGMYDQGAVRQHVSAQMATGGSSSSVALPGRSATPVLALPAPDGTVQAIGGDPFAASLSVPPPSYVQMAEIEKKQQLLVQEQQLWQQYSRDGMQGQLSLNKLSVNAPMPYGMPPLNNGLYYYGQ